MRVQKLRLRSLSGAWNWIVDLTVGYFENTKRDSIYILRWFALAGAKSFFGFVKCSCLLLKAARFQFSWRQALHKKLRGAWEYIEGAPGPIQGGIKNKLKVHQKPSLSLFLLLRFLVAFNLPWFPGIILMRRRWVLGLSLQMLW